MASSSMCGATISTRSCRPAACSSEYAEARVGAGVGVSIKVMTIAMYVNTGEPAAIVTGALDAGSSVTVDLCHEQADDQRQGSRRRSGPRHAAAVGVARRAGHDRHEIRLWPRLLRLVYGAREWGADPLVQHGAGRRE